MKFIRQIILQEINNIGQNEIKKIKILLIGLGGIGSSTLIYLISSGLKNIALLDYDTINITNLHRQIIYNLNDLGKNKSYIAYKYIKKINPNINIKIYNKKLNFNNSQNIIKKYNFIIDATDNMFSKFLINDTIIKFNNIAIYGAVFNFEAYISIFSKKYSCYRCIYKNNPYNYIPDCLENGILNFITGLTGIIQSLEIIKLIIINNHKNKYKFKILLSNLLILDLKKINLLILKIITYICICEKIKLKNININKLLKLKKINLFNNKIIYINKYIYK